MILLFFHKRILITTLLHFIYVLVLLSFLYIFSALISPFPKKIFHKKEGYDISKKQVEFYIKTTGLKYDNLDKRKIVRYLIYKNYFKNILEVYDTLIGKGQKLYIPIKKLSPENIIDLIDKAGGVSVLAHPCTLNLNEYDLRNKIKELMNYGLDGIEVINSKSNLSEKQLYKKLANEFNLIETVGSDFHSPKEQSLGVLVEDKIYNELVEKIKCKTIKT